MPYLNLDKKISLLILLWIFDKVIMALMFWFFR